MINEFGPDSGVSQQTILYIGFKNSGLFLKGDGWAAGAIFDCVLGPPVEISVNFDIKSMGPVSEDDQSFGLDCYFRQHWYDLRLQHEKLPGLDEFSLSWLFLDKVWKPDTYFVNGKKSHLHRITSPNKFLRLRPDGFITYSMRLTILASCPMYLRKFPLDAQRCPLIIGSCMLIYFL